MLLAKECNGTIVTSKHMVIIMTLITHAWYLRIACPLNMLYLLREKMWSTIRMIRLLSFHQRASCYTGTNWDTLESKLVYSCKFQQTCFLTLLVDMRVQTWSICVNRACRVLHACRKYRHCYLSSALLMLSPGSSSPSTSTDCYDKHVLDADSVLWRNFALAL